MRCIPAPGIRIKIIHYVSMILSMGYYLDYSTEHNHDSYNVYSFGGACEKHPYGSTTGCGVFAWYCDNVDRAGWDYYVVPRLSQ